MVTMGQAAGKAPPAPQRSAPRRAPSSQTGDKPSSYPRGSCAHLPSSLVALGTHRQVKGSVVFFI